MDLERTDGHTDGQDTEHDDQEIADELLIEEISIDGMCGVY
jgi:mycofactocin precursor